MDGQYVFEEIKQRYEKSNKYMLCVTYEDIGILIQMVDILDKQLKYRKEESNIKLTKEQKEIEELKAINKKLEARKYMYNAETGEVTAIPIDNNYISKAKIKAKIEKLDKEIKVKREIAKNPMDKVSGRLLTDSIVELEKSKSILQSLLKDGGITMVEEIEETLQEYYEFLTIEVEYVKIRTYKIFISAKLADFRDSEVIKGVEFYYNWEDHLTFTVNIEQMRYNIEKAIIKFFRKENKEK